MSLLLQMVGQFGQILLANKPDMTLSKRNENNIFGFVYL